jgi:hypothetical protein
VATDKNLRKRKEKKTKNNYLSFVLLLKDLCQIVNTSAGFTF